MLGFAPIGGAPIGGALFSGGSGGGGGGEGTVYEVELSEWLQALSELGVQRSFNVEFAEVLALEPVMLLHYGVVMTERLGVGSPLKAQQFLGPQIVEAMRIVDTIRLAYAESLTDGIAIHLTEVQQRAVRLVEQITIAQVAQAAGYYGVTITERALRFRDTLAQFFGADVVEGLGLATTLTGQGRASATLVDTVAVDALLGPHLMLSTVLHEGVELEAEQLITTLFQPTLEDGVEISAGYLSPGGSFTAWAMNARTGAVSEYTNYAFNSFAQMGTRCIGASSTGLYDLTGDDDDGEDIIARLRSGFMQFGGTHLSRLKAAYIAARGEGEFILRIETGDGAAYNYQVSTRNMRSTKITMGKGQRARYFLFELVSAGQDFDLDTLEFVPVVVERRV